MTIATTTDVEALGRRLAMSWRDSVGMKDAKTVFLAALTYLEQQQRDRETP